MVTKKMSTKGGASKTSLAKTKKKQGPQKSNAPKPKDIVAKKQQIKTHKTISKKEKPNTIPLNDESIKTNSGKIQKITNAVKITKTQKGKGKGKTKDKIVVSKKIEKKITKVTLKEDKGNSVKVNKKKEPTTKVSLLKEEKNIQLKKENNKGTQIKQQNKNVKNKGKKEEPTKNTKADTKRNGTVKKA